MKYILLFVLAFAALTLASTTPAQAAKSSQSEPVDTPDEDRGCSNDYENSPGCFEESYEGNDREDEYGDLFSAAYTPASGVKTVTEDRGTVLVVTTTRSRDAYQGDTCAYVSVQIIDKKTRKVTASDSINTCDQQIL